MTAILHPGLRNCFFFICSFSFSNFYLVFYFPFLFGLLLPFFFWTFISLFSLDFYSISVTFWISSKFLIMKNIFELFKFYYSLFQENPIICWTWLNLWSIPGDFLPTGSMLLRLFTVLENLRRWPSLHFWPLLGLMKTLLIPLSKVKWNNFGH